MRVGAEDGPPGVTARGAKSPPPGGDGVDDGHGPGPGTMRDPGEAAPNTVPMYRLGIDLGSTYTTAAVGVNGAPPRLLALGSRTPEIPSVVFVAQNGDLVVGEAAEDRGDAEPGRLVRNVKQHVVSEMPVQVGGSDVTAARLLAALLRHVAEKAGRAHGGAPTELVLTVPAGWGAFQIQLFDAAVELAGVGSVTHRREPEAAVAAYAARTRLDPGAKVAVYDLGGVTFDASVLERVPAGLTLVGAPQVADPLGGADFDEAVYRLVTGGLGDRLRDLDRADPEVIVGLARLRRSCVAAKESLSTETEASVRVDLPGLDTSVRVTRSEFESLIRSPLRESTTVLRRALASAGVHTDELTALQLIGGSAKIPAVAGVLQREFGVPLALSPHPQYDTALGSLMFGPASGARPAVAAFPVAQTATLDPGVPGPSVLGAAPADPAPVRPAIFDQPLAPAAPVSDPPPPPYAPGDLQPAAAYGGPFLMSSSGGYPPNQPRRQQLPGNPPPPNQTPPNYPGGPPAQPPPGYAAGPPPRNPGGPGPMPPGRPTPTPGFPSGHAPMPPGPPGPGASGTGGGSHRNLVLLIVAAVVVLGLVVGTAVWFLGGRGQVAATPTVAPPTFAPPTVAASTPAPSPSASGTPTPSGSPSASPSGSSSPLSQKLPTSAPLPANLLVVPIERDGERDLYLVDLSKKAKTKLLPTPNGPDSNAMMQPDRTTIIYINDDELRVMAADGTGDRVLLDSGPKGCGLVQHASWDQDDPDLLLLACLPEKNVNELMVVKLDGTVVRRLKIPQDRIEDPTLSADGQTVAYWASNSFAQQGGAIYTVPFDGSEKPTKLTKSGVGIDADPAWSPDGEHLAFRRKVSNGTANGNLDVFVMRSDGKNPKSVVSGPAQDNKPVWSPDSRRLLVVSNRTSKSGGPGSTFDLWEIRLRDGKVLDHLGLKATRVTTPFWVQR